jgi:purine-nucleoside phosphorylase
MRASTAPGHAGRFVAGVFEGKNVLAMQGRLHLYEGYTPEETAFPVRLAALLGAKALITTCAVGGINEAYKPGTLALITDTLNLTHTGPLVGFDISDFTHRFIDMSYTFNPGYRRLLTEIAGEMEIGLQEGIYFYMPGPQFESPAEIRAIRALGGDMVGMSCVHETVMALRCGMEVAGLALVSNMAAGIVNQPITEEEVLEEGRKAAAVVSKLVTAFIERMELK